MYINVLCVALVRDDTIKININIQLFSKNMYLSCIFNLDLFRTSYCRFLTSVIVFCIVSALHSSHASDTKPGQVPDWVMIICCVVVVQ